jgi:eukaryotic-like serine/threonine-protein kinase
MSPEASPPEGIRIGDVLAGKYKVERVLGAGGMGVVLGAYHLELDERVAIKLLSSDMTEDGEAVARFQREARAAVKIKSEHVARVLDVGRLESGAPYIVMEHLEGRDLGAWLDQDGPLPIPLAVDFVLQACEAIAEAHALGIVHRDLKPSNLFCVELRDGTPSVKVLDFGISKMSPRASSRPDVGMTRSRALLGSPQYMAPEQLKSSRQVDPRSDIWSLGVVLYELVAGKPPFGGEEMPEIVINIASNEPLPLASLRPDAPPELASVIVRCLEKDADRRFSNVAEFAVALASFAPEDARASIQRIERVLKGPVPPSAASRPQMTPRSVGLVDTVAAAPTPRAVQARTLDGHTSPRAGARSPFVSRRILAACAVALLAASFVVVRARMHAGDDATPAATPYPSPAVVPSVASAPPETAAPSGAVAPEPAVNPVRDSPEAGGATVNPAPTAHGPAPRRAAGGAPKADSSSSSRPKPDCTNAYFIDGLGHKQYKKECL